MLLLKLTAASVLALTEFLSPVGLPARTLIDCKSPHLHPGIVLTGSLARVPSASGVVSLPWIADDRQGDAIWSAQGPPPASSGRLFLYNSETRQVSILRSRYADTNQRIQLISISPGWIVFVTSADSFSAGDWRIVVRSRRTGTERVVARGVPGGLLAGQFGLDGSSLVWIQPTTGKNPVIEVRLRNLATGRVRILSRVSAANNLYTWLVASQGHVAWEWDHMSGKNSASDVLVANETSGKVQTVTTSGAGSQPSISWPYVAYLGGSHFAHHHTVYVRDLLNHLTWSIHGGPDIDRPQIGGGLVLYRPSGGQGFLSLYSLADRKQVVLKKEGQIVVDGAYMGHWAFANGLLVGIGEPIRLYSGQPNTNRYVVTISRFADPHPLRSVLTCTK